MVISTAEGCTHVPSELRAAGQTAVSFSHLARPAEWIAKLTYHRRVFLTLTMTEEPVVKAATFAYPPETTKIMAH